MPTLILYLNATPAGTAPSGTAAPEFHYVVQGDDLQTITHGRAVAALLPNAARGTEVVAVLPAHALSWHVVNLPEKVAASVLASRTDPVRTRAVLSGAMEEQLLDEASHLHFATFTGPAGPANPSGATGGASEAGLWVAVCDRNWLRTALATLEAAGCTVARIVAECEPADTDASGASNALAVVTAAAEPAQLVLCTSAGVTVLPLGDAAVSLARSQVALEVFAEPAVMGLAEAALAVPVRAQNLHQSMVRAAQSGRNLAQLEFSPSKRGRAMKRLGGAWQTMLHAPQWRPVRWGLVALLVSQVVALNAAAYRQQALIAQKRAGIEAVLQQTFPNIPVIVDAPVQMQREVSALAQSRGASDADVARLLTAVAAASGNIKALTAIDLSGGDLRLKANGLSEADVSGVSAALGVQGWQARLQGDQWVLQRKEIK
jgi:general secretion pathway protein L